MIYSKKRVINKAIPDNDPKGLDDSIHVLRNLTVKFVSIDVSIKHPFAGDIKMELKAPNGEAVVIREPSRRPDRNLKKNFSGGDLTKFEGMKSRGDWTLNVVDGAERDNGSLLDWTLNLKLARSKKSEIFVKKDIGLGSSQYCHQTGFVKNMKVKLHMKHEQVGDVMIDLVSPSGTTVNLYNKTGGGNKEIKKIYSGDNLASFVGEEANGRWTIMIRDETPKDAGKLLNWSMDMTTSNKPQK